MVTGRMPVDFKLSAVSCAAVLTLRFSLCNGPRHHLPPHCSTSTTKVSGAADDLARQPRVHRGAPRFGRSRRHRREGELGSRARSHQPARLRARRGGGLVQEDRRLPGRAQHLRKSSRHLAAGGDLFRAPAGRERQGDLPRVRAPRAEAHPAGGGQDGALQGRHSPRGRGGRLPPARAHAPRGRRRPVHRDVGPGGLTPPGEQLDELGDLPVHGARSQDADRLSTSHQPSRQGVSGPLPPQPQAHADRHRDRRGSPQPSGSVGHRCPGHRRGCAGGRHARRPGGAGPLRDQRSLGAGHRRDRARGGGPARSRLARRSLRRVSASPWMRRDSKTTARRSPR